MSVACAGRHEGITNFTVGQQKGAGTSRPTLRPLVFVLKLDSGQCPGCGWGRARRGVSQPLMLKDVQWLAPHGHAVRGPLRMQGARVRSSRPPVAAMGRQWRTARPGGIGGAGRSDSGSDRPESFMKRGPPSLAPPPPFATSLHPIAPSVPPASPTPPPSAPPLPTHSVLPPPPLCPTSPPPPLFSTRPSPTHLLPSLLPPPHKITP